MAESPIKAPYGDIVFYESPYTDQAVAQLQQEARLRRAQQEQENKLIDTQFQKELGKVRSVDQPDLLSGYNNIKQLKKQLLFDKSLRKDPLKYNQLQQQLQLATADFYKNTTRSAEVKKQAETIFEDRIKNPDKYVDDFGGLITQMNQTPLSQGGKVKVGDKELDLFSPDTYMYRGGDFDFGKSLKDAAGTLRPIGSIEEPVGTGQLQTKITPYSYGNSPAQVRDYLLGTFAQRGAGRAATYQWNQLPEGEYDRIKSAYDQIPAEKLKRMGLKQKQELSQINPDNPAANYANYLAMRHAVYTEPTLGTPQYRTNQEALLDRQLRDRKIMAAISKGNAEDLARLRQTLKGQSDEKQQAWLNWAVEDIYDRAKKKGAIKYKFKDGTEMDTYEMELSPQAKKSFGEVDVLRLLPDGRVMGFTYERYPDGDKKEGQVKEVNGKRSVASRHIFSPQEFKARLGKDLIGVKALNEALGEDVEDIDEDTEEQVDITTYRNKYDY